MYSNRPAYGQSSRQPYSQTQDFAQQLIRLAAKSWLEVFRQWRAITPRKRPDQPTSLRQIITIPNILISLWLLVLFWGERWTFWTAIRDCDWQSWEQWPADTNPHHLAFIADPQIVDPHTYPSRPWPLSSLTYAYTDIYMTRVYHGIQNELYPDTTVFLGDLFDGGREWGTLSTKSPEKRWEKYEHRFWLKEYNRFGDIFVKQWQDAGVAGREGQPDRRKLVLTLPGNHDLGFAKGVEQSVRRRYYAYFGEGNRVDTIGNHTFVSLDSLSLSAMDYPGFEAIAEPPSTFLTNIRSTIRKATAHELASQSQTQTPRPKFSNKIVDAPGLTSVDIPQVGDPKVSDLPTVLLTHVPLYREANTPCGPFREHMPQGTDAEGRPLEKDEHNAIRIEAGHQYQNVLSLDVTKHITSSIGNIRYAFSGDDHDYCEITHRIFPSGGGGIREITVKSLSWAMGVRKPGFVMLSLWNPIDVKDGNSLLEGHLGQETIQSHLCLLPDQLGIFLHYAVFLVFTLSVLIIRAGHFSLNPDTSGFGGSDSPPLLPLTSMSQGGREHINRFEADFSDDSTVSNTSSASGNGGLSVRTHAARKKGGYGLPSPVLDNTRGAASSYFGAATKDDEEGLMGTKIKSRTRRLKGLGLFHAELRWSLIRTILVVLPWYLFLIWTG